ncbi:maleylpyruvate isomerase family mycothiol-dependent enzyme [Arthrobacter echini]|uniref:Maleylpyruvate isomerase family mycothiol-dependent enzyme n=1 Tax=Arthrobacter echini TaxID=1529066 RepID=A0A4S5E819_9MICC|nr:maleylpyruvate isomerase family mycothiol-dependent enzyme [Arthrobacter echini]THJ67724.1 maleylpyruvate isomerase family mycothiol-dependent enzyme [Arthrobacter echini]
MARTSRAEIWNAVHDERRALIDDLAVLETDQWHKASSCPGWDVHDVLAHLVDTARTTRLGFVRQLVAARFDFDRANAAGIEREKSPRPEHTLDAFRAVRSHTATPPAALATRLVEAFVHGEDIRRPLTIRGNYPPELVAHALAHQVRTSVKIGGGKEIAQGCHLVASDTGFDHGDGPEVRGPAIALLLAVSGRPVRTDDIAGPGVLHLLPRQGT